MLIKSVFYVKFKNKIKLKKNHSTLNILLTEFLAKTKIKFVQQ